MNKYLAVFFSALLLTACGGGSSSGQASSNKQNQGDSTDGKVDNTNEEKSTFSSEDAADEGEDVSKYIRAPAMFDKDGKPMKFVMILGNHYGNFNFDSIGKPAKFFNIKSRKYINVTKGTISNLANDENYSDPKNDSDDEFQLSTGNLINISSKSYKLYQGKREAELYKFSCLDGLTLGQQELQVPTNKFAGFIKHLNQTADCKNDTQVLAVNLTEEKIKALVENDIDVKPYLTQEISWGKTMAWIGVAYDEDVIQTTDKVQRAINELALKDIHHIGLVSAMGTQSDKKMLESLTEVDVILGQADDTTVESSFNQLNPELKNVYNLESMNRQGKKVCLSYTSKQIISNASFSYDADIDGNIIKCESGLLTGYINENVQYEPGLSRAIASLAKTLMENKSIYIDGFTQDYEKVTAVEEKYPLK